MSGSRAHWAIATVVLLLAVPSRARAGRPSLVVLPASGRGVSARIVERARHLFVESLGGRDRFHVVDYDRPPTSDRANAEEAVTTAQLTGATIAVAFDISHEGADTIFDVHCWDGTSGENRCHMREKTAAGPDLLPDFTEWLAMRLVRELDSSPDIQATSDGFLAKPRREPRMITFGARTTLMVPVESPSRTVSPLGGFAFQMAADTGSAFVTLSLEHCSGNEDHSTWGVGLGVEMPLASAERLPYLGASAWFIGQKLGGQGATGFQLRPTLGVLWGRHDVARLRTEVSYFVDFFEERTVDRLIPGSDQSRLSHGIITSVGVTF